MMGVTLPWLDSFERSKKPRRLPVVLAVLETQKLLREAETAPAPIGLIIRLLYGTGMRLMEALRLELTRKEIIVRMAKVVKIVLPCYRIAYSTRCVRNWLYKE